MPPSKPATPPTAIFVRIGWRPAPTCRHWLVDVTYGRIGARGRTIRTLARDEAEARKLVRQSLRRRGTARKRIGVGYELKELSDPEGWSIDR